jgi:proteasome lid subunit RPN8/RPN11
VLTSAARTEVVMTDRQIPGLDAVLARDVYPHCFGTVDREVGGVLIGSTRRGSPPEVEGSIRALGASETATQLTFTQDSWEHIHRVLEEQHPSRKIVGWYHTHPGYGLFLSAQDLFIHRNFFGDLGQVALVIDPVAQEEAVFAWFAGEIHEYYRRPTAFAAPHLRSHLPLAAGEAEGDYRNDAVRPGASRAVQQQRDGGVIQPRLSTWIYLATIGMSAGVVFWQLLLR